MKRIDFEQELVRLLRYWSSRMVDEEHGGFHGRINGKDQLVPLADKGAVLNARILWTFSAAHGRNADREYLRLATRAFDYFNEHFVDPVHGGIYWMLDHLGHPVDSKKQVYAQAFAIYGLSEFYKITQDERALRLALELFDLLERQAFDPSKNGYREALTRSWQQLEDVRLSEKDMNAQKTMNTHLHILEGYTNLYRVHPSEHLAQQLEGLIELMIDMFLSPDYHFHLFFDDDWHLLSHEISYGHDIEGSWLLHEAAEVLGDQPLLAKTKDVAIKMVEASLEGMDEDGGLMNEGNERGVVDGEKHWWPQAEALVGLLNAYQLTADRSYLDRAEKTWQFIREHLIDNHHGEWHWKVSRNGKQQFLEDKAGPWKCPYHNGRAMIEVMNRLNS